jgi:hypothetical protein
MYIFVLLAMTFSKYKHPLSGGMGIYIQSMAKDKTSEDEQTNFLSKVRMCSYKIITFLREDDYKQS